MLMTIERRTAAKRILPLVDLTSLGDDDQPSDIDRLCENATTTHGAVASVCVWPRFVAQAVSLLAGTGVAVCAVANFPEGDDDLDRALADSRAIVEAGGVEVDVVIPWRRLAAGDDPAVVERLVAGVRDELDSTVILKAILESGELADDELIAEAGRRALAAGADFLKTSTGKTERSATPEAVAVLADVVGRFGTTATGPGIKVSGGVGSVDQAIPYLEIVDAAFGSTWVGAKTFRFGASRLLGDVVEAIG